MTRKKADGAAFEHEFKKRIEVQNYVKRLPTLNTGYSGLRQPADFIVVGNTFSYVELKETAKDSFSITGMEQLDQMKDFVRDKIAYSYAGRAAKDMRYLLIVHFIERKTYKVLTAQEALSLSSRGKALHYDTEVGVSFSTLDELGGFEF